MRHGRDRAFTLIELMMVVAIIAIVTAITIPQLVGSMRGNRLRSATRMVVMSGRYARSMAVLRQEEMAVVYDMNAGRITIRPARSPVSSGGMATADGDALRASDLAGDQAAYFDGEVKSGGATPNGAAEVTRKLDRVTIEYVEVEGAEVAAKDGTCTILYSNSGRCTEHTIRIRDEFGQGVTIDVDALSTVRTSEG